MNKIVKTNETIVYPLDQYNDPSFEALANLSIRAEQAWVSVSLNAHSFAAIIDRYNSISCLKSYKGDAKVKACTELLIEIYELEAKRQEIEMQQEDLRSDLLTWIQTDENRVNLSAFDASIKKIDELINISDGIDEYGGLDGLNLSKSCIDSGPKTNTDKLRRIIEMDLEKETQKNQCAIL